MSQRISLESDVLKRILSLKTQHNIFLRFLYSILCDRVYNTIKTHQLLILIVLYRLFYEGKGLMFKNHLFD